MLIINKNIKKFLKLWNKYDYKYILKILLIKIILIRCFFISLKMIIINNKIKVCLCTVGKLENNYPSFDNSPYS